MRWPWQRDNTRNSEATKARLAAEKELAKTRAETPMYRELAAALRDVRTRNHLGEAIAHSFRGDS